MFHFIVVVFFRNEAESDALISGHSCGSFWFDADSEEMIGSMEDSDGSQSTLLDIVHGEDRLSFRKLYDQKCPTTNYEFRRLDSHWSGAWDAPGVGGGQAVCGIMSIPTDSWAPPEGFAKEVQSSILRAIINARSMARENGDFYASPGAG